MHLPGSVPDFTNTDALKNNKYDVLIHHGVCFLDRRLNFSGSTPLPLQPLLLLLHLRYIASLEHPQCIILLPLYLPLSP